MGNSLEIEEFTKKNNQSKVNAINNANYSTNWLLVILGVDMTRS